MEKFLISKEESKDCSHDDLDKDENDSNSDDSLPVEITIKKTINKNIRIGKYSFDEETLTRASIVKLAKLGYKIKQISKILRINRNIAWKWYNFERCKGKGTRKPKFTTEEKKFLCEKVEGKVIGKDEASSRALQKEFYEKFKK